MRVDQKNLLHFHKIYFNNFFTENAELLEQMKKQFENKICIVVESTAKKALEEKLIKSEC